MMWDALIRSYLEQIAKHPDADHEAAREEVQRLRELQRQLPSEERAA